MFSFTLHVQSDGWSRSKNTRVYLCASSPDESGTEALDWALDSLVQDGDELIVFRGIDTDDLGAQIYFVNVFEMLCTHTPSPEKDHDLYRDEARELMRMVQEKGSEYDPDRKVRTKSTFYKRFLKLTVCIV